MKSNKINVGGKDTANFIFKDIGCGTLHHNNQEKNTQRKKNKISTTIPM